MRRSLLASLLVLCVAALVTAAVLLRPSPRQAPLTPSVTAARASSPAARASAKAKPADGDDDDDDEEDSAPARRRSLRAAPVWTVDKAASRLSFRAVMDGTPFDGVFRTWDAQIAFDPRTLASSHATFTVDTTSALTGQPIKDQALPNSEWLATEAYPQASLITRSIVQTSDGRYQAAADLHIRGVTWRTTVPFTVKISRDTGHMDAVLTLDRRTFGIGEGPFRSPAPVEPTVQIFMKLVATRNR